MHPGSDANHNLPQEWWYTPAVLILGRLRQDDLHKSENSLGYINEFYTNVYYSKIFSQK